MSATHRQSSGVLSLGERRERFVMLPVAVLRQKGLSDGAIVTYGLLLDYARTETTCWPSIETLCTDRGGLHRNTVRAHLAQLVGAGLIAIHRRGQGRANVYHVLSREAAEGAKTAHPEGQNDQGHAQSTVHNYAQSTVHNDQGYAPPDVHKEGGYAQSTVHLDAQSTVHLDAQFSVPPYKEETDARKQTQGNRGTAAAAAGPPPPPGPDPGDTHEGTEDDSGGGGDGDAVTPYRVAAALLVAQGRPARRETVLPLVAAVRELVVEPYAGRVTMEQIRGCLADMAQRPYFAQALHRLTSVRLAADLGPWLVAHAPPRQRQWCECGSALDEGQIHTLHCKLWGPATSENYVDRAAKELIWFEPWRVRTQYRALFLTPEEREVAAQHD